MTLYFQKSFFRVLVTSLVFIGLFSSLVHTVDAAAEYTAFNPFLELNSQCQVVAAFDLTVVSASVTPANSFFLNLRKIENGATVLSHDFPFVLPLNGELFNYEIIAQNFTGMGEYKIGIIENNPNEQLVSQSDIFTLEIPDEANCTGNNQQQNNNNQTETPDTNGGGGNTDGPMDIPISNPVNIPTIPFLIQKVLEIILKIGIPLLVIMIIYSGALYLFARGNPSKIGDAHNMFLYTLIGGAILLGAWALSELIYTTLIEITAFGFSTIHNFFI